MTGNRRVCRLKCTRTRLAQQDIGKNGQRVSPFDDSSYRLQGAKKFILRCFENDHVNSFMAYIDPINGCSKARAETVDELISLF